MAVECLGFETYFRNKLTLEKPLEVLWVGRFGFGEHALVYELINRATLHLECVLGGVEGIVASERSSEAAETRSSRGRQRCVVSLSVKV